MAVSSQHSKVRKGHVSRMYDHGDSDSFLEKCVATGNAGANQSAWQKEPVLPQASVNFPEATSRDA